LQVRYCKTFSCICIKCHMHKKSVEDVFEEGMDFCEMRRDPIPIITFKTNLSLTCNVNILVYHHVSSLKLNC
jgi:hypothetical protein